MGRDRFVDSVPGYPGDQCVLVVRILQESRRVGEYDQPFRAEGVGDHRGRAVPVNVDHLAFVADGGGTDDGQVTLVEERSQERHVRPFDPAGVVVPQDLRPAVLHDADIGLPAAFEQPSVHAAQADGVDAELLQFLDDAGVALSAVHHGEDVQGLLIGDPARVPRRRRDHAGRLAQLLGYLVQFVGSAVHQHQRFGLPGDVFQDVIQVDAPASARLHHDHEEFPSLTAATA